MDEFKVIKIMNSAMIKTLKDKNESYEKNSIVEKYLKYENCFFKMDKKTAYDILLVVGVNLQELENVYKKLTSEKKFFELLSRGIIKADEDDLVVNYIKKGDI